MVKSIVVGCLPASLMPQINIFHLCSP